MRKLCLLSLLLMTVSCNQSVQMTEDAAIAKLQEFFEFLDIEQYNKNALAEVVTDDFHIFEMGQDFTLDAFDAFSNLANKSTEMVVVSVRLVCSCQALRALMETLPKRPSITPS